VDPNKQSQCGMEKRYRSDAELALCAAFHIPGRVSYTTTTTTTTTITSYHFY